MLFYDLYVRAAFWYLLYSSLSHSWCTLLHFKTPSAPLLLFVCRKGHEPRATPAGSTPPRSLRVSATIPQQEKGLRHWGPCSAPPHPEQRRSRWRGESLIRAVNSWTLCWYYLAHNGRAGRSHPLGRTKDDTGLPGVKVCVCVCLCVSFYMTLYLFECVRFVFEQWQVAVDGGWGYVQTLEEN